MSETSTAVLTYHSIGTGRGPTSIPPEVFAAQMRTLAGLDYRTLTLGEFLDWRLGRSPGPDRRVLITFDDGFADFQDAAHPVLRAHGFSALVFLPTGKLGGVEDWVGGERRPLMGWAQVDELAGSGVEFGAHGVRHADLTGLDADARRAEVVLSGRELATRLGRPTRSFAAPYGRTDSAVRADIANHYEAAFGTRLGRARRDDDVHDLPRIEMHYFRDLKRWRGFLEGETAYLAGRRALRAVRELVTGRLQGAAHG